MASLDPRLAATSPRDVIATAEAVGSGRGQAVVIALYTAWIAAQTPGARDRHAARFNLGTDPGRAGDGAGAIQAYRAAPAVNPGFAPAAINLGLQLERPGAPAAALGDVAGFTWHFEAALPRMARAPAQADTILSRPFCRGWRLSGATAWPHSHHPRLAAFAPPPFGRIRTTPVVTSCRPSTGRSEG